MTALLTVDAIKLADFSAVLARYDDTAPAKLADLDAARYHNIPAKTVERAWDGGAYLSKDELVKLVEWKVSHGKFRPSLKKLASENDSSIVESVTKEALALKDSAKALKVLTSLRGVGPATASLLLSVCNKETPFFSDELFRWCLWEDTAGGRWDRSIKYNVKEYTELSETVAKLRQRLGKERVTAVDCEKVAYVLGKTEVDLSVPVEAAGDDEDVKHEPKIEPTNEPTDGDDDVKHELTTEHPEQPIDYKKGQSDVKVPSKKRSAATSEDTTPSKQRRSARTKR